MPRFISHETLKHKIIRKGDLSREPVTFPNVQQDTLPFGGQNKLIKAIIEHFCAAFAFCGLVLYIGSTEYKFLRLEAAGLAALGVTLDSTSKIPDVILHYHAMNWLLIIEEVTSGVLPSHWTANAERSSNIFSWSSKADLLCITALDRPCLAFQTRRSGRGKCGVKTRYLQILQILAASNPG